MRGIVLLGSLFSTVTALAQNWALLNPAYRYNYSDDGTDTIRHQIRVMDVDTLGVDSFRYELNLVAKVCDTCTSPGLFILLDQPQFMQRKLNVGPTAWHFHDPGSFVLLPQANLGDSWIFDTLANIEATVSMVDPIQVFDSDVQRKIISLSDGDSIVISEPFGVLSWNGYELIGEHGPDVGRLIPSLEEMFPYQSGDVVEYSIDAGGTDGISSNFGHGRLYKFTVDDDNPTNASVLFDGTMIDHRWNWTSYWNGPIYVTSGHLNIFGTTWTAGRPELPWADLLTSYPGQLIGHRNDLEWWSDSLVCIAYHGIDDMGHRTIRCLDVREPLFEGEPPGQFMHPFPDPPQPDQPVAASVQNYCNGAPDQSCGVLYTEGMGLNWLFGNYFESFEEYVLVGSVVSGDTIGTVHSDDYLITLSVDEIANHPSNITPNPANDRIQLTSTEPGPFIRITDLNGRVILTRRVAATNETIDVHSLQPGAYLLQIDGFAPQRFMIVR
ncbi:MAG: T9SS type A sorting domain-containing protein [Flavobacteriales bacterium]|nr:T9SS type A sorting domain-containing protein [Flavobacteriales bacterium]